MARLKRVVQVRTISTQRSLEDHSFLKTEAQHSLSATKTELFILRSKQNITQVK